MADEANSNGPIMGPDAPQLQIVGQYIRDLSFENPAITSGGGGQAKVDFGVDIKAGRQTDTGPYEVTLKLRVTATQDARTLFLLELSYAGLFILHNVPEESLQPVLLIECPRLLFPFARRVAADVIRDGSLPPLMIDPIDFAQLYRNKQMAPGPVN